MVNHNPDWNCGMAVIDARREEKTEAKLTQVRTAIQTMLSDPDVPVSHVNANRLAAREDTPSRWFIREHSDHRAVDNGYDHDLATEITQACELKKKRLQNAAADDDAVSASKARGYLSQIKTLMTQVNDYKAKLAAEKDVHRQAREQLALALGAQREGGTLINPRDYQEKLNHIQTLNGQVRELNQAIRETGKGRNAALERIKAVEASNDQLGEALQSCTCHGNVVHLTGTTART